jgi:2-C-methyl-D-erythritol 4-phosphate cytidylyltransferase
MVAYSLRAAGLCDRVDGIVLVVPAGHVMDQDDLSRAMGDAQARDVPIETIGGGTTRQASVRAGLSAVAAGARVALVHDAARPFATSALFNRVLDAIDVPVGSGPSHGAIPVVACRDTVKRVERGVVVATIPREDLFMAQTPQAFDVRALADAHERAVLDRRDGTDDSMLLEAAGYRVVTVPGEETNIKVTSREDLARAEWVIRERGGALPGANEGW